MPRERKRGKGIKGRGSVFPRKDGRWVAQFIVEETGEQKQLYAKTEKEAYEKLDKALQEQKQGILATGPNQKLGDFLNWWLEEVHKNTIRQSSYLSYRGMLNNHILPELGHIQLRKVTTRQIQTLYNKKLKEKLAPSTVHIMHAVLHGAMDRAVKLHYISYNPANGVSLPSPEPQRESQALTLEQARHLLKVARGNRLEAFVALALTTGMRHGELTALRWSDITFGSETEAGSIYIHRTVAYRGQYKFVEGDPKTKKSIRTVPFAPAIYGIMETHRQRQNEMKHKAGTNWKDQDLVFTNRNGGFLKDNATMRTFYKLIDKANSVPDESGNRIVIPRIHIHDLRHTAATLWQSQGISEKVAQELLGHSNVEMTRIIYTHVIPSMQKEAAEKINSLFQ